MRLNYVVITSVTRDDLPDGGAEHFAETIGAIRRLTLHAQVEVLVPDFQGKRDPLDTVLQARPDVLNHNIETVERLYPVVRPQALYHRSLELLRQANHFNPKIPSKSGIMLGLGEEPEEVHQTLHDLFEAGCRIVTIGQYLQPSEKHLPVARFITPHEFDKWRTAALEMGFSEAVSGPFVRSSYHASEVYETAGRGASRSDPL
jgi:lipoic acid synthetase